MHSVGQPEVHCSASIGGPGGGSVGASVCKLIHALVNRWLIDLGVYCHLVQIVGTKTQLIQMNKEQSQYIEPFHQIILQIGSCLEWA